LFYNAKNPLTSECKLTIAIIIKPQTKEGGIAKIIKKRISIRGYKEILGLTVIIPFIRK
jgi:hypothetical protein